jgi:Transposase DDE domain
MPRSRAGRRRQRRRYEQARQVLRGRLADHERQQKRQRKAKRRPAARVKICPSEPEAALGKDKTKVFRPLYNTQILQDVDSPFVLGYGVYATVTDAGLLPPMLERTRALTGRGLEELLTDGTYARLLDVRCCREQGVRLYAPLPAPGPPQQDQGQDGPLGKEAFTWLEEEHTYCCPQGHVLRWERRCREQRRDGEQVTGEQYRCAKEHCQGCPLAPRCTKRPDKGRTVKRLEGQELLDEVGQRTQAPEGKERYQKRCQTVELRHADFRQHRGLARFPSYGLRRARSLIGLLVLAHNGLALLDARDAKKAEN